MANNRYHSVRQGEYIPKIIALYGLTTETVWNHPENSTLKADRKQNPNILYPGDQVYVPEIAIHQEMRPTDQHHRFVRLGKPLNLRIVLQTYDGETRSMLECMLSVDGDFDRLTADSDGLLERHIPATASEGRLTFQAPDTSLKTEIKVLIGNLDPVTEVSGQIGRLNNLGYLAGNPDKPDPELLQSAIEEFQCDHQLHVDGVCGSDTQAQLEDVHGC